MYFYFCKLIVIIRCRIKKAAGIGLRSLECKWRLRNFGLLSEGLSPVVEVDQNKQDEATWPS